MDNKNIEHQDIYYLISEITADFFDEYCAKNDKNTTHIVLCANNVVTSILRKDTNMQLIKDCGFCEIAVILERCRMIGSFKSVIYFFLKNGYPIDFLCYTIYLYLDYIKNYINHNFIDDVPRAISDTQTCEIRKTRI